MNVVFFTSVQSMEKWEDTTSDLASCSVTQLDVRHPPSTSTITMFTEKLILCDLSSSEPVTSVSFSRDGHCILASSLDDRLRLLDKDNGELLNEWVSAREKDWLLPSFRVEKLAIVVLYSNIDYPNTIQYQSVFQSSNLIDWVRVNLGVVRAKQHICIYSCV